MLTKRSAQECTLLQRITEDKNYAEITSADISRVTSKLCKVSLNTVEKDGGQDRVRNKDKNRVCRLRFKI